MKLTLARWDDHRGCSAGIWLVKEIPALILIKETDGWHFRHGGWLTRGGRSANYKIIKHWRDLKQPAGKGEAVEIKQQRAALAAATKAAPIFEPAGVDSCWAIGSVTALIKQNPRLADPFSSRAQAMEAISFCLRPETVTQPSLGQLL